LLSRQSEFVRAANRVVEVHAVPVPLVQIAETGNIPISNRRRHLAFVAIAFDVAYRDRRQTRHRAAESIAVATEEAARRAR